MNKKSTYRGYTDAQRRASIKYMQEKTDDIRLRVPKGTKDAWKEAAARAGYRSMTAYVVDTIRARIDQEPPEDAAREK